MITEFEVRQTVASIETSTEPPIRKVRLLMRLNRRLKKASRQLSEAASQAQHTEDRTAAASLNRMHFMAEMLQDDVRDAAARTLKKATA